MPIYAFICPKCGHTVERLIPIKDRRKVVRCQGCRKANMQRDFAAERINSANQNYSKAVISTTMGVAAADMPAHRRMHPDIPLTPQGDIIIANEAEYKRIRRKLADDFKPR